MLAIPWSTTKLKNWRIKKKNILDLDDQILCFLDDASLQTQLLLEKTG